MSSAAIRASDLDELGHLWSELAGHGAVIDDTIGMEELARDANLGTLRRLCAKERERLRVLDAREGRC